MKDVLKNILTIRKRWSTVKIILVHNFSRLCPPSNDLAENFHSYPCILVNYSSNWRVFAWYPAWTSLNNAALAINLASNGSI